MRYQRSACRAALVLFLLFPLTACGGRSINKRTAHDLLVAIPEGAFDKNDVIIRSVSQTGRNHAIAEATVQAAFKLENIQGRWVIQEVRLGNGQWEKLDHFLQALARIKIEETRKLLDQVAGAAEKYIRANGSLPEFTDYVSLSNALNPDYMPPLIREDAWRRPLAAYRLGSNELRLVSSGPDGQLGSADDIELRRTFSP